MSALAKAFTKEYSDIVYFFVWPCAGYGAKAVKDCPVFWFGTESVCKMNFEYLDINYVITVIVWYGSV